MVNFIFILCIVNLCSILHLFTPDKPNYMERTLLKQLVVKKSIIRTIVNLFYKL